MAIQCEVHQDCEDPAVAQVGLPGPHAVWVCRRGFEDFQEGKLNLPKIVQHASDCAVHNEPAFPPGPCDCGAESE